MNTIGKRTPVFLRFSTVAGERGRGSITTKMNTVSLLVVLFAVAASAEEEVARKPKLFLVHGIPKCGGRKRRSINIDGLTRHLGVRPVMTGLTPKDAAPVDLEPSQREQAMSAPALHGSREGRFLLYWITTTPISTSTSYTTTYSFSSALCTAPGANLCG